VSGNYYRIETNPN